MLFLSFLKSSRFTRDDSRITEFRLDHSQGDDDLKMINKKRIQREPFLDENFWPNCKAQIDQTQIATDNRVRFWNTIPIVRTLAQDLRNTAVICQLDRVVLKRPISSLMVMYCDLPSREYSSDKIMSLYGSQMRHRRRVNNELLELMIVSRHIQHDQSVLPVSSPYWKFSNESVAAINDMAYLMIAADAPLQRN